MRLRARSSFLPLPPPPMRAGGGITASVGAAAASSAASVGAAAASSAASGGAHSSSFSSYGSLEGWGFHWLQVEMGDSQWNGTSLGVGVQAPKMVNVIDEVPEAQIPQLLHLPQAERLIEADVKNLLNFSLTVVQIVQLNKEVTGKVSHVSPLLTEIASVDLLDH